METSFLKSLKQTIKHWYIPLLVGIFFVVVSIVVFSSPAGSLVALSLLFALSFLFSGLSESLFALANKDHLDTGFLYRFCNSLPLHFHNRLCHRCQKIWQQKLGRSFGIGHNRYNCIIHLDLESVIRRPQRCNFSSAKLHVCRTFQHFIGFSIEKTPQIFQKNISQFSRTV